MIKRPNIFAKIFLGVGALATIPLLLITALITTNYQNVVQQLESEIARSAAPELAAHITAEIGAVSFDVLILVSVLVLISLILVTFAALYLSREFTWPIKALLKATQLMARGELGVRLESSRSDEFGSLAAGFNRMATQLKEAQDVLEEANVVLENRVAQRTAELEFTNFKLQAAAAKMAESMRAKSEFLANVSHELLTPLHAVLGYSDLLGDGVFGKMTSRQQETIGRVQASAETLRRLINDIIDLAKIESGRMTLTVEDFSLADTIGDVTDALAPTCEKKKLLCHCEIQTELPRVRADRRKLQYVLFNLLSNAVKFTDEGEVGLAAAIDQAGQTLTIQVRDTGPGIPADKLSTIFEDFRQLDGSTTRRQGGAGIGLSLSRQLVELMGGTIEVESVVGQGTTFRVSLPLELTADPPEAKPERVAPKERPVVLAVDDDPELLELLVASLEPAGYRVIACTDGNAAISKAKEMKPYAMTLDIHMPERDGWSVLEELRGSPATAMIPVIVLSVVDDRRRGDEMGVDAYLTKPFDRDTLLAELDAIGNEPEKVQ